MKNEQAEGLTWLSAGEARRISWRRRCPPPVNQSVIVVNKAIDAAINYAVFQALLQSRAKEPFGRLDLTPAWHTAKVFKKQGPRILISGRVSQPALASLNLCDCRAFEFGPYAQIGDVSIPTHCA